jgi:O-antigen/teichoic acid export membrane protein
MKFSINHDFFSKGLSKNISINIIIGSIFKLLSVMLSFILVPLLLGYLGIELYSIWLLIFSIVSWLSITDTGFSSGLINNLSKTLAVKNFVLAKKYIATTFFIFLSLILIILLIVPFFYGLINWNDFLNSTIISNYEILTSLYLLTISFLINILLSLINNIFHAIQKSFFAEINIFLYYSFQIIGLLILINFFSRNLIYLTLVYSFSILISNSILIVYFFKKNPHLIPHISDFDLKLIRNILSQSANFFIIQFSGLIIFSTDNLLITHYLGLNSVVDYNIALKLIRLIIFIHTIILTPFWPAFTIASSQRDIVWIKKAIRFLIILIIPFIFMVIGIIYFSDFIIQIWLGDSLKLELLLVVFMGLFSIISIWNNIFAYLLNSLSEFRLQIITSVSGAILNIPVSIFLIYIVRSNYAVILGTILSLSIFSVFGPIETIRLLRRLK